jgi:hypothetical protein
MAIARVHPNSGIGGVGNRDQGRARSKGKFSWTYLRMARVVLRFDPSLADEVSEGAITLKRAFRIVREYKKRLPPVRKDAVPQLEGTKSQKLMALAQKYPNGKTPGDLNAGVYKIVEAVGVSYVHLKKARWVFRKSQKLATAVLRGETSLHMAWKMIRGDGAKINVGEIVGTRQLVGRSLT